MSRQHLLFAISCVVLLPTALRSAEPQDVKEVVLPAPNAVTMKLRMEGPYTADVPLQIVCYFKYTPEGVKRMTGAPVELDKELGGVIAALRERHEFVGNALETVLIVPPPGSIKAKGLLLVGLGDEAKLSIELLEQIGKAAMQEAKRIGSSRVAFAPLIRDQGNTAIEASDVERAVIRGVLLAYDTELRLQREGLAKQYKLDEWIVEAGPAYFDDTTTGVQKGIEDAKAAVAARPAAPYRAGGTPQADLPTTPTETLFSRLPTGFTEKNATVNGVKLHYTIGGTGPVVILLHGYTQTSHMWKPLLPLLAKSHTVIAPDLRGFGDSERAATGYDKKTMAKDIHELVRQLGFDQPAVVVGHDIGLMVAYAYAAQYPADVRKVALLDAFLPGIGDWKNVWLMRDLWHFHFYGDTALALVKGRERIYFEHFWNDFAADKTKSISEADRQLYAAAYAKDDGMRAGFEVFKNFEQDARDFAAFSQTKLDMPFLVLTGEKASGTVLIDQTKLVANHVKGVVVAGSGHWLMEEAPGRIIPELVAFINDAPDTTPAGAKR